MKSKHIIVGMLAMLPVAAIAQQHITQAFDALRQSERQQETSAIHSVEKDPDTGVMEGMRDIYDFTITDAGSKQSKKLITDIVEAFRKDEPKAYSILQGSNGGNTQYTSLAVGNSNSGGIAIGMMKGSKYMYALFIDPDDTLRHHRYAYAFEWVEDSDNKIHGKLVKTYATTKSYRESKRPRQTKMFTFSNSFPFNSDSGEVTFSKNFPFDSDTNEEKQLEGDWLGKFNNYKDSYMKNSNNNNAMIWAMYIYDLCKRDTSDLSADEKKQVTADIEEMKKNAKDWKIQKFFEKCIEQLKQ